MVMRVVLVLSLSLWLAGCASNRSFIDEPIIDRKGVDMSRYYVDKEECEAYADEVRTGEKVARGAVGGAVVGGAIGAIPARRSRAACPPPAACGGHGREPKALECGGMS